jgi:hypothetical protein
MQKISTYLYPNRIELLADLAGFTTEYTNVYQRTVKIYNGIDNVIEFDIKNADQKRIETRTGQSPAITQIELNIMDVAGTALPNSPYTVTPTSIKGIVTVTIPEDDLVDLESQFLKYSVTALKDGNDVMLYGDSRFGAVGRIELVGDAMPTFRDDRVYNTFTADIDLKGQPTYHSSAIPATFYEAVPTEELSFEISLKGFTGSVWVEGTTKSTINTEAFKNAPYLNSYTFNNFTGIWNSAHLVEDYQYFRISYTTPVANGLGSSFTVDVENGVYKLVQKKTNIEQLELTYKDSVVNTFEYKTIAYKQKSSKSKTLKVREGVLSKNKTINNNDFGKIKVSDMLKTTNNSQFKQGNRSLSKKFSKGF